MEDDEARDALQSQQEIVQQAHYQAECTPHLKLGYNKHKTTKTVESDAAMNAAHCPESRCHEISQDASNLIIYPKALLLFACGRGDAAAACLNGGKNDGVHK